MKKTLKAVISATLTLVMLLAVVPFTVFAAYETPLQDITPDDYFYEAVIWAYSEGITTGTTSTKFAPQSVCTRGQVVTFLWRAMGEPEPTTKDNPFGDVKESDYYYNAVLWAVENGITTGTSAKRFSPDVTCTNAHILTFIWRALGEEGKTGEGEWYTDAENWAKAGGLLEGTYTGELNIKAGCPRANVITYLYRYLQSTALTIFVSADADAKIADGSAKNPFATVEAARDYLRSADKSGYTSITVRIGAGDYQITEPIEFTEEDSGTKDCPVRYVGADGTTIAGGIVLHAEDFVKAEGGLTEYFPEEARDKIVMVDMTKYGLDAEFFVKNLETDMPLRYHQVIPFLSVNGTRQTIAQYPNGTWLHVGETVTHSADGTTDTAIDRVTLQTINYGEEHFETVTSWSEAVPVFVRARLFKLWCPDDSVVVDIDKKESKVDILFAGGHEPELGTIMYFYNVPEELDIPGEYIYDKNAVLYYYPTDEFETATLTVPLSNGLIKVDGANHITFKNIEFTLSNGNIIDVKGDNISIVDCEISASKGAGVNAVGNDFTLEGCSIHDIGSGAVKLKIGDVANVKGGNALVYNNDIYEYGVTDPHDGYGVTATGVNITVSHNDVHDANFKGIHFHNSVNAVAEYNDVWRVSLLSEDTGVMSADGKANANVVFRYNYVHDCFPDGEAAKILDYNPDYLYYGSYAFYYDGGCSYIETYGNVAQNVDNGYLSNAGRGNSCHNNLFINCRKWYVHFSEFGYGPDENGKVSVRVSAPDYIYNNTWKKLNPDLAGLITSGKDLDPMNPMIWTAPAKNSCYDNWIHYNRAERLFTNWGVRPYNIETWVMNLCKDDIKIDEKQMSAYSSARTEVNIKELLEGEAGKVVDMDWERFQMIGRIGE